jgi:transcription elongation factor Elf1
VGKINKLIKKYKKGRLKIMTKNYESNKKGYCPKCGKEISNWTEMVIDGNILDNYFVCECGLCGCETYELKHTVTSGC